VLDKNPENFRKETPANFLKIIQQHTFNNLLYLDPFVKMAFINKLISDTKIPVLYLDFDLLFAGNVSGNTITLPKNVSLILPEESRWDQTRKDIIKKLNREKSILVLDSVNSFFLMLNKRKDVGRFCYSYIMFLGYIAKLSKSTIILGNKIKRMDESEPALTQIGMPLIQTTDMKQIRLGFENSIIKIRVFDEQFEKGRSFDVSYYFELN